MNLWSKRKKEENGLEETGYFQKLNSDSMFICFPNRTERRGALFAT